MINQSILRQIITISIIIILGLLIIFNISEFIPSFLGAATFYILFRNVFLYLVNTKKWKSFWATIMILATSFLLILAPATLLIRMAYSKAVKTLGYTEKIKTSVIELLNNIKLKYNINLLSTENINKIMNWITETASDIINSAISSVTIFIFAYFILYFMLMSNVKMENKLMSFLPFRHLNAKKVGNKIYKIILSNTIGIPLVALAQGITGLIGYSIIGIDDIGFWFVVTIFASMIPIVGSALAYVPIAFLLLTQGETFQSIFILLYGIIVIGSVDNIFRFTLLKKMEDVHPLITVFGILLGVKLFGFLGIIFGPLLICLFILLVEVYRDEYNEQHIDL